MLRISFLFITINALIFSCNKPDKALDKLVLKFDDSLRIGYNIPVFINESKYTYLSKENFDGPFIELFLNEEISLEQLSSFELKRMDYFGSVGLYIDSSNQTKVFKSLDTVTVKSNLEFSSAPSSDLDTADVINIIKVFQEVGKKYNDDSIKMMK